MDSKSLLVSVIIPVYQTEEYLNQCVQSVLCQTYPNLEIILVDDGSPDACPALCDILAAQDDRVYVIHKKNKGAAFARKAGLDVASGQYVLFLDSDDWLDPGTISACVEAAQRDNAYAADVSDGGGDGVRAGGLRSRVRTAV